MAPTYPLSPSHHSQVKCGKGIVTSCMNAMSWSFPHLGPRKHKGTPSMDTHTSNSLLDLGIRFGERRYDFCMALRGLGNSIVFPDESISGEPRTKALLGASCLGGGDKRKQLDQN